MSEKTSEKSRFSWKWLENWPNLAVALCLGYYAYAQNETLSTIQTQQKATDIEVQLVAVVWPSLTKGTNEERASALVLVETFSPSLRLALSKAVSQDPEQPEEIAVRARRIARDAEVESKPPDHAAEEVGLPDSDTGQLLREHKIDIYYDRNSEIDQNHARAIKDFLEKDMVSRLVVLAPRQISFLDRVGRPFGYEVRYERGREDVPASELQNALNLKNPEYRFNLRGARTPTPGLLSLFLFSEMPNGPAAGKTRAESN